MKKKMDIFLKSAGLLVVFFLLAPRLCFAVPHLINYQGRLTDKSGKPLDSGTKSHSITFQLFNEKYSNGSEPIWEEKYTAVSIKQGVFSVTLGSIKSLNLPFNKDYYLQIKVDDEVMKDRQQLTSVGYALMAQKAEEVASLPPGIIVMWSGTIATIPSGWALCDGGNGTPDLRDRFIVGARQDESSTPETNVSGALTYIGGEAKHTLTIAEMPAHTHDVDLYTGGENDQVMVSGSYTNHYFKTKSDVVHLTGGGQAHNILPPYYALAFIMKISE